MTRYCRERKRSAGYLDRATFVSAKAAKTMVLRMPVSVTSCCRTSLRFSPIAPPRTRTSPGPDMRVLLARSAVMQLATFLRLARRAAFDVRIGSPAAPTGVLQRRGIWLNGGHPARVGSTLIGRCK